MVPNPPDPLSASMRVGLALVLLVSLVLRVDRTVDSLGEPVHFDERFPLQNISRLLRAGEIEPRHAYYSSLSYLPQAAVLAVSQRLFRWTGNQRLAAYDPAPERPGFTRTALFLARATNVVFGVLALWLLFAIGRRLFDPGVGLLAAAVLAALPRHAVSSTHFKPDILVLLLALVTFWWALDALEKPGWRRFLKAGAGVGLALAAKLTGVAAALPVAGAAWWSGRGGSERPFAGVSRWGRWVAAAGAASIATFLILNPFIAKVWLYARETAAGYAAQGAARDSSRWTVLWREAEFLWRQHGAALSVFVALGTILLARRALKAAASEQRGEAWLVLSILLGWTLLHPVLTPFFRAQNYLVVTPFTSLAAALGLAAAWRGTASVVRRSALIGRWPSVAIALTCLLLIRQVLDAVFRLNGE